MTSTQIIILATLLALSSSVSALSWPACSSDTGGSVWVTQRPFTGPVYPGANLFYFCSTNPNGSGGVNILGNPIDPCLKNGTVCNNPAIATAICQLLGYEKAWEDDFNTTAAQPGELVRSLTGEYCLRKGVYSLEAPEPSVLSSMPGEPCQKISSLACVRTIDTLNAALALGIQQVELAAVQAAPAAEDFNKTATLAEAQAVPVATPVGRKLLNV